MKNLRKEDAGSGNNFGLPGGCFQKTASEAIDKTSLGAIARESEQVRRLLGSEIEDLYKQY
jgi:hypothetical protein